MSNGDLAIDVSGLNKSFSDRRVVRDFAIQVQRGHICGFLGPNGSGKTTTIRMLCGLLTPDSGTGTCLGYDIRRDADKIKLRVGYMTQRFSLYQDLSVREEALPEARVVDVREIDVGQHDRRRAHDGQRGEAADGLGVGLGAAHQTSRMGMHPSSSR